MEDINPVYEERLKRLEEKIEENFKGDEKNYNLILAEIKAIKKDMNDLKKQEKNIARLEVMVENQGKQFNDLAKHTKESLDKMSELVQKQADTAQIQALTVQKISDIQNNNSVKIENNAEKLANFKETSDIIRSKATKTALIVAGFFAVLSIIAIGGEDNGWQAIKTAFNTIKDIFL